MSTKSQGYITFNVHCGDCHHRLSARHGETQTTYRHDNASDCSGDGADIELPTVTVEALMRGFLPQPKAASKKKAK